MHKTSQLAKMNFNSEHIKFSRQLKSFYKCASTSINIKKKEALQSDQWKLQFKSTNDSLVPGERIALMSKQVPLIITILR